jgi:protein SCO1/2
MTRSRMIFAAACLALAGAIALAAAMIPHGSRTREGTGGDVGGPFQLVDQDGRARDQSLLNGKYSVVFFGFTFCPDVCPTMLQTLGAAQDRLGTKAKKLQIVFVSVDPERDTPAVLKTYMTNAGFPKGVTALTGTPEQVARAAKAYRVYYAKSGEGPDYAMDHSTAAYLMDPNGRFVKVIPAGLSPDDMADQIRKGMAG